MYRYDGSNGVKELLATAASGVPVIVGEAFGIRVTVTGTTITMQKTAEGDVIGTAVTARDSTHRPLTAFAFGRCGVGFRMCGVSVG